MPNICFIVRSLLVFLMECQFSEWFFHVNTNDSNVKDTNISHKECLLLSCIASFEDWSWIFRTRSSPCARTIWIITTCLTLLQCKKNLFKHESGMLCEYNKSPLLTSIIKAFHSEQLEMNSRQIRRFLVTSGFPWASGCTRGKRTFGTLTLQRETKFIIGFDFAVTLSSPEYFRFLFDITSAQSGRTETANIQFSQNDSTHHAWNFLIFGVNVLDLDFGV